MKLEYNMHSGVHGRVVALGLVVARVVFVVCCVYF